MDLQKLPKTDPVDLEQVKVKLREIEHLKVELRLARFRAIEQGKALLSPEQHEKLQALLGESRYSRLADEQFSPPMEDQP
jgi:Spy/CpxP family protein refolding chaperone